MIDESILNFIESSLGISVKKNETLKPYTTIGVGGVADYFAEVSNSDDLKNLSQLLIQENQPIFILGGGSNLLIGDKGIRGFVIRNSATGIKLNHKIKLKIKESLIVRKQESSTQEFLKWRDLKYNEITKEGMQVEVDSGTSLAFLINKTLDENITGLEWFARIPGTIGGAIWNNIHGADHFFGDYVASVKYIDKLTGNIIEAEHQYLNFRYNYSFFHERPTVILSAKLNLPLGNISRAKYIFREWVSRKNFQPYNSMGSTFSNLSEEEKIKYNLENLSAGYLIDKILNLKGTRVGGAMISDSHSNFIVNMGGASASDVLELITLVKEKSKKELGFSLKEEIVCVGEF